jgi:chromosomal replication initiation ATPase DnaA
MKTFLYISGRNGTGKTCLLLAMEKALVERSGRGSVIRAGTETLVDEMVSGLGGSGMEPFLEKYGKVENLLVDNYWVLARRPHAARILAQLFHDRISMGRLTVTASDLPPTQVNGVNDLFAEALFINLE